MKKLIFRVRTKEQLECAESLEKAALICPPWLIKEAEKRNIRPIFLELPDILRENRLDVAEELIELAKCVDGVVIKNIDEIGLITKADLTGQIIADPFLYAYIKEAVMAYRDIFPGIRFIASDELTDAELEKLWKHDNVIYKIYGRQRVMFTAQSFHNNFSADQISQNPGGMEIESLKKDRFLIVSDWGDYDTVLTEKPVSMLDKYQEICWEELLVDLTTESGEELSFLMDCLRLLAEGKTLTESLAARLANISFLRGHHYKGID